MPGFFSSRGFGIFSRTDGEAECWVRRLVCETKRILKMSRVRYLKRGLFGCRCQVVCGRVAGGCRSCFPELRSNGCRVSGDGRRSVRITGLYRGMEFPCGGWCRVRCEEHDGEEVVKEAELSGGRHSEATRVSARRCFRLVFDTCDSHGFF